MPPATLLAALGSYNLLPAIVFLPTRRRCDQAASEAALLHREAKDNRRVARRDFMRTMAEQFPEIRRHRHWDTIIRGGVASHHAGHIPAWKLAIEKLMSAGLLDAIFATATVAAGVDFPARTVVITVSDARTGHGWRQLTASELQQMTGRAGRRGRDNVGFVVAAPGVHQDPQRIAELLRARPDPLVSQFRATYTTLLNLLDAYENFAQVREIVERSFAHRDAALQIARLQTSGTESEERIQRRLKEAGCNLPLTAVLGMERLASVRTRLQTSQPQSRADVVQRWLDEVVQPGRVVGIGRSGKRLVIVTEKRGGNIRGIREDGRSASFASTRIGRVYSPTYRLTEESIDAAFAEVRARGQDLVIPEPRLRDAGSEESEALSLINERIDSILLNSGSGILPVDQAQDAPATLPGDLNAEEKLRCTQVLWELLDDAENVERSVRFIETLREEVWAPFEQRAQVLATFGYLDYTAEKVTERGRWLADLHVDRPLLVGEALEAGLFNALEFHRLAGVMAALTADGDRDYGEIELEDALVTALAQFEDVGFKVATEEWKLGVEPAPELNFSAASTAAHWASGAEWTQLVHTTRAEEGDLFRMLSRTGEGLVQIAQLKKAHPEAARIAAVAADAILREPVR